MKAKGISVEDAMESFGISRPMLFKLYNREDQIPDKYYAIAKKMGLTEVELTPDAKSKVDSTVQAIELIDRLRADHREQMHELYETIKHYRLLIDECRKVNGEYRELLKKNKVQLSS